MDEIKLIESKYEIILPSTNEKVYIYNSNRQLRQQFRYELLNLLRKTTNKKLRNKIRDKIQSLEMTNSNDYIFYDAKYDVK